MEILSTTQIDILKILDAGGKIFVFDNGTYGLDDVDGNTLNFRSTTFHALNRYGMIEITERPCLGCDIYGLTPQGLKAVFKVYNKIIFNS
jgi:hypothetical protein